MNSNTAPNGNRAMAEQIVDQLLSRESDQKPVGECGPGMMGSRSREGSGAGKGGFAPRSSRGSGSSSREASASREASGS